VYENAWKEIISEYFSWKENRRGVLWEFLLCFSDLQWINDVFSKCKHIRSLLMSAQWGNHECKTGSSRPQKSKNNWEWGSLCSCRSEKRAVNFSNKGLHRWSALRSVPWVVKIQPFISEIGQRSSRFPRAAFQIRISPLYLRRWNPWAALLYGTSSASTT